MKQLIFALILSTCFSFMPARKNTTMHLNYASPFVGKWSTSLISSLDGKTVIKSMLTVKMDEGILYGMEGLTENPGASDWVMFGTTRDGYYWTGNWSNADGSMKGTFALRCGTTSFSGTYTKTGVTGSFSWSGTKLSG